MWLAEQSFVPGPIRPLRREQRREQRSASGRIPDMRPSITVTLEKDRLRDLLIDLHRPELGVCDKIHAVN